MVQSVLHAGAICNLHGTSGLLPAGRLRHTAASALAGGCKETRMSDHHTASTLRAPWAYRPARCETPGDNKRRPCLKSPIAHRHAPRYSRLAQGFAMTLTGHILQNQPHPKYP